MLVLPRGCLHRNLQAPRSCSCCSPLLNHPHVNEKGGSGCQKVDMAWYTSPEQRV